jgi:hypothetical protein
MATKKSVENRSVYWNLYWWSLMATFLGVILGAFLMWRWALGNVKMSDSGGGSQMIITGTSGIASHYPNSETAYQVTIKNVTPRILWLGEKRRSVSLDKFLSKVWYLDNGEKMREEPLLVNMILNKPTDGKMLVMPLLMRDPRYDSRAKTLIFRADVAENIDSENKISDIPSSFLVSDMVFDAGRFSGFEYLTSFK